MEYRLYEDILFKKNPYIACTMFSYSSSIASRVECIGLDIDDIVLDFW